MIQDLKKRHETLTATSHGGKDATHSHAFHSFAKGNKTASHKSEEKSLWHLSFIWVFWGFPPLIQKEDNIQRQTLCVKLNDAPRSGLLCSLTCLSANGAREVKFEEEDVAA